MSMIHAIKGWQKELALTNITAKLPNPLIPIYLHIYIKTKKVVKTCTKYSTITLKQLLAGSAGTKFMILMIMLGIFIYDLLK